MKQLLLGLFLGFGTGWLVFDAPRAKPPVRAAHETVSKDTEAGRRNGDASLNTHTATHAASEEATRAEPSARPEAEVPAILAQLRQAREQGDWERYRRALNDLGSANTTEAQKALRNVLGDTSIKFRGVLGGRFFEWLANSELDGVAEAARKRYAANIAAGDTSWTGAVGLFDLVSRHGDDEDLAWLEKQIQSGPHSNQALVAFSKTTSEQGAAIFEELFKKGMVRESSMRNFIRVQPERAFAMLDEALDAPPPNYHSVLRNFAEAVPAHQLAYAKRRLNSVDSIHLRLQGVYAIERLKNRKLDVTGLERLAETPYEVLRGQHPGASVSSALYVIEYSTMLRTSRSLDILAETKALHAQQSRLYGRVIKELRAELGDGWK